MQARLSTVLWAGIALGFALAAPARAQSPPQEDAQGGCKEVRELVERIDADLAKVNELLAEASAVGASPAAKVATKSAQAKQKEVAETMQKILEHAHEGQCKSGSCSSKGLCRSSSSKGGGSQGSASSGSTGSELDGRKVDGEKDGAPRGEGQAPRTASAGTPDSPRKSTEPPKQGMSPPREYDTEKQARRDAVARWGDLPEQIRDAFANERTDDLPVRYRKWIQAFYRRAAAARR